MADYFASSVVLSRKTRCHLVAGADSYRVEMPNGTGNFRNFQISRKKDNLERWTEIFETIFRKLSVPLEFEPEFPEILVEWNAPDISQLFIEVEVNSTWQEIIKVRRVNPPYRFSN